MPKIPGVPHLQAVRALEKAGFSIVREGKHIVMSDGRRILTIPPHNPINAYTMVSPRAARVVLRRESQWDERPDNEMRRTAARQGWQRRR